MDTITVAEARKPEAVGRQVRLQGWVRTRRDSKGGFSFLELNDGSCQGNVQVVADGELPNYESEVKHLHTGASVAIEGEVKASPAKGQATEVHAAQRRAASATPTAETYPLQKKGHTFEFLRDHRPPAAADQHLRRRRPRAQPVSRSRSTISSRSTASSTSTRRSSPPATAKGPARCSASRTLDPDNAAARPTARSTTRRTSSASRRT